MNSTQQFLDAIASAGLTPPDTVIGDGKIHRFSTNGRARDDAGWYVFHDDEHPAGRFGCNRSGVDATWSSKTKREFTPEEKQEWKRRLKEREAAREAEIKAEREQAANQAADLIARAHPANGHAYLKRKQIEGIGALELDGELLIPMKAGPRSIVGLQRIQPDGDKRFLKGTPAGGAYTVLGKPAGTVIIGEGYATCVSIHTATRRCVVVAFNAGNLEPVAKKIRAAMPDVQIIIAADDDAFTDGNPGMTAAHAAARAVGGLVAYPMWAGERGRGTDFNDLHVAEGLDAVAMCFEDPQPPADRTTNTARDTITAVKAASDQPVPQKTPPAAEASPSPSPASAAALPIVLAPATVPAVNYFDWLSDVNDKGKPLATIQNLRDITDRLGIVVRYNVIKKEEEILIPNSAFSIDNRQNAAYAFILSECAKFRMPTDRVGDFLTYLADSNLYNPVANWITSKPWDGQDHLSKLIATVTAVGEKQWPKIADMKRAFITRWMLSAVAAAFRPNGVSAHGVLVFQGDQYIGKTKWFKTLVPANLEVLSDGVILRPEDRDSVKQCVANWLVELGELDATFRKSDIAALKAFLTKDRDILRRAYAKKESEFARRTVFFASVNPKEFLHDPTGNRRYWTIECEHLDHDHGVDMQQCWAQVYEQLFLAGASWFLSPEEMDMLNAHNKGFEVIDPIEEIISTGLAWDSPDYSWNWASATDVLVSLGRDAPSQAEATRAAHIIRARNGRRSRKSNGHRQLLVPEAISKQYRP